MIFMLTLVLFRLTIVQTFTVNSLNNPLFVQLALDNGKYHDMYKFKKSVVCSLYFTLSLHYVPGLQSVVLQSAFYTHLHWARWFVSWQELVWPNFHGKT